MDLSATVELEDFLFPAESASVTRFLWENSKVSLVAFRLSLAFTNENDYRIMDTRRHNMINLVDLEMQGRLILLFDDLFVRYFIDDK